MSNWICPQCPDGTPVHQAGDGPVCSACGVEMEPADDLGVLRLV